MITKIKIESSIDLDEQMHFLIGGSWDYKVDKYPDYYPCVLVISKDHQFFGYVYKHDLE